MYAIKGRKNRYLITNKILSSPLECAKKWKIKCYSVRSDKIVCNIIFSDFRSIHESKYQILHKNQIPINLQKRNCAYDDFPKIRIGYLGFEKEQTHTQIQ